MRLEQRVPGDVEQRLPAPSLDRSERAPRLRFAQQQPLGLRVHPLLVGTGREGALESPGVAVRVTELTAHDRQPLTDAAFGQSRRERAQRAAMNTVLAAHCFER